MGCILLFGGGGYVWGQGSCKDKLYNMVEHAQLKRYCASNIHTHTNMDMLFQNLFSSAINRFGPSIRPSDSDSSQNLIFFIGNTRFFLV